MKDTRYSSLLTTCDVFVAGERTFLTGYLITNTGFFEVVIGEAFSRRLHALSRRDSALQALEAGAGSTAEREAIGFRRVKLRARRLALQNKVSKLAPRSHHSSHSPALLLSLAAGHLQHVRACVRVRVIATRGLGSFVRGVVPHRRPAHMHMRSSTCRRRGR